jgi:hypothetical protein
MDPKQEFGTALACTPYYVDTTISRGPEIPEPTTTIESSASSLKRGGGWLAQATVGILMVVAVAA